ncbi:hypothetical protein WA577_004340, partial [Blastocystis sp. JDR]
MQGSLDEYKINYLVLKHLERYADKLPSLGILKREIENDHLLGESIDIDDKVQPISFKSMDESHKDLSPLQLSLLVEEGIDHLKSESPGSAETIDLLQPIQIKYALPSVLRSSYKSIYECLVDYCKLLKERVEREKAIQNYTVNGDCEEEVATPTEIDVKITLPENSGLGVILTNTEAGVFVKSFSKGFSIARETHQIQEQDQLCAVNGHPVQTTVEARDLILQTRSLTLTLSRMVTTKRSKLKEEQAKVEAISAKLQRIESALKGRYSTQPEAGSACDTRIKQLRNRACPPCSSSLLLSKYRPLITLAGHSNSPIYGLAIDSTQRFAFTGADDHLIKVWDIATGCLLQTIRGHRGKITDLVINANNSVLMSASEDGWIFFWDITPITVAAQPAFPRFRCVGCCCLHKGFVCQLKYDAVNDLLFSAGDDGLVCAWNVALVDPMKPHARQNLGEEELLVFALQHGGSFRFGGNSGTSPANSVLFCDLSPDGRFIATGAKDGTVRIWRIPFIVRNDMQVTR